MSNPIEELVDLVARALAGQARRELEKGVPQAGHSSTPKKEPAVVAAGGADKSPSKVDYAASTV